MGAQQPLVRVTLLEPYRGDPTAVLRIPGGQVNPLDSIATHITINPADPAFQAPFNKDENVLAYGRRDGPIEVIDMHQNIVYEVSMQPGCESTLVPIGTAKTNFGDWDVVPGSKHPMNPKVTYDAERLRVAMRWGGFKLFPFTRMSPKGDPIADTRKIAPPDVPHVRIELINQRGLVEDGALRFEPWPFYQWDRMVDKQAAAEAARRMADNGQTLAPAPVAVDNANLIAQLVEAEVAKRLGNKKAAAGA